MPKLVAANLSKREFDEVVEIKAKSECLAAVTDVIDEPSPSGAFVQPKIGHPWVDAQFDVYTTFVVRKPWRALCQCYGIIFITIILGLYASGVIIPPSGNAEYYIKDAPATQRSDMLESARTNDLITNTSERSQASFYQLILYENDKKDDIFTPKNLQAMCEFEKTLVNFKMPAKDSLSIKTTAPAGWLKSDACPNELDYRDYCLLDAATKECTTPASPGGWSGSLSVVSLFYGAALLGVDGEWDCALLDQASNQVDVPPKLLFPKDLRHTTAANSRRPLHFVTPPRIPCSIFPTVTPARSRRAWTARRRTS